MTLIRQHSFPSIGLPPIALTQRWRRVLADLFLPAIPAVILAVVTKVAL